MNYKHSYNSPTVQIYIKMGRLHKKVRHIPTKSKSEIVNVSNNFIEFFKTPTGYNTGLSIHAGRIVVKIINDLKDDAYQYSKDINNYRTLFDQDLDSDYNSFASFKFRTSDISKSNNTEHVKSALDYLSNYGYDWHESTNEFGETVKTKVGFINLATYSNGYIGFQVPKFWVKRLIDNTSFYNKMMYDLAFNLTNSKHFLFHIWLMTLKAEGTKVKLETLNNYFFEGKGYKRYADMNREFLKKVKINLDKFSNRSFNYSYSDKLIHIVPYSVVPSFDLSEDTDHRLKVTQKLNYFKQRNGLSDDDLSYLKTLLKKDKGTYDLFLAAFSEYKRQCKIRKYPVTHYQGKDFLESLQRYSTALYKLSEIGKKFPDAFPIFVR